ncbi:hypothetical protein KCP69_23930 [Salmonella enterica subsp. enterica]|nr:hypothetical protein KCP69_23930 [Salmonella enterica subsp. enterica]
MTRVIALSCAVCARRERLFACQVPMRLTDFIVSTKSRVKPRSNLTESQNLRSGGADYITEAQRANK